MQVQGIITGKYIKLLRETDLPDGQPVTVNIRPDSFSLEEKRRLLDELKLGKIPLAHQNF